MKVLIDTNVIIDVLMKREPHALHSAPFLKLCGAKVTGCLAASQTTDIFYLLVRMGTDEQTAKTVIKKLTDNIKVLDVIAADVQNGLASEMTDYEEALLAVCAKRVKADYIVTRNEKNFQLSPVTPISPEDFEDVFVLAYGFNRLVNREKFVRRDR